MTDEALDRLATIPLFEGADLDAVKTMRLGGLTNRNYRIDSPLGNFVLRLAGEGTGDYIDRVAESQNARIAADAGVNAEVMYFDADDGTMLCRYVEGSVTLDAAGFKDPGAVARAGTAFRKLHDWPKPFAGRFELFAMIDEYLGHITRLGAALPDGYDDVRKAADAVREALGRHDLPSAPCHCDPLAENFLDTGERIVIIDYEYAGNNDPMWDLGDLSVEAEFDAGQEKILLSAYFAGEPPDFEVGRMVMYKALCDLLWTLWGVMQVANENPAEDFRAYALGRLDRCRALMASPEFPRHLDAVRAGP